MKPQHDEERQGPVPAGKLRKVGIICAARCHRCGWEADLMGRSHADISRAIHQRGWRKRQGTWYCPACSGAKDARDPFPAKLVGVSE